MAQTNKYTEVGLPKKNVIVLLGNADFLLGELQL